MMMKTGDSDSHDAVLRRLDRGSFLRIAVAPVLLWLAQPPLAFWPLVLVAIAPWLVQIALHPRRLHRERRLVWLVSFAYWSLSLQGLRHAHPLMVLCLLALSGYLAVYSVAFFVGLRGLQRKFTWGLMLAPVLWVGLECLRNYLLTGISVLMLGHSLAGVPHLIQIADLGGTYAVSLLVMIVNTSLALVWLAVAQRYSHSNAVKFSLVSVALLIATVGYGIYRFQQPTSPGTTSFLLVGRDEPVEYDQNAERELEVFQNYAEETLNAVRSGAKPDVIVWPESMFTGGLPWFIADADAVVPPGLDASRSEFMSMLDDSRQQFLARAAWIQNAVAQTSQIDQRPEMLVGCGVVRYADYPRVYCGIVHFDSESRVADWYGKNHLVMFGEYIPLLPLIPGVKSLLPPGLGVTPGAEATLMNVGDRQVVANICIETAVERVPINHIRSLGAEGNEPDVMVTVTNDGWFDRTSVVEHHLRCAQLVAVGCRTPILSAGNGGPTAWIDSCGRVASRLPFEQNGALFATPERDSRKSLYVSIGDLPARFTGVFAIATLGLAWRQRRTDGRLDASSAET